MNNPIRTRKIKTFFILAIAIWTTSGVVHAQDLSKLKCNQYTISSDVVAYDTSGFSLEFTIVGKDNKPLKDIPVTINYTTYFEKRGELERNVTSANFKTDAKGVCYTELLSGVRPVEIYIGDDKDIHFYFGRNTNGYGYRIFGKLCD